jgi:hypothetical protein
MSSDAKTGHALLRKDPLVTHPLTRG